MTVTVAEVETTRVTRTLPTTGTVAASDLIPVLPQTNGLQIIRILVNEGDVVKAGQVIALLDDSVLQAQISQAKADMESNRALVVQKQAALAQARASLAEAQRNFQRYQQLANQGAISRQELDTRATAATTAREAVRVAEANISSAEADVRSSNARVAQLQTQLGQTVVRASARGVVTKPVVNDAIRNVAQVGDVASTTVPLFSLIKEGLLEVEAQVSDILLPQVKIGALVQITSDADSRVRLQGRVRDIEQLVDQNNRKATVNIDLPPTDLLRPGMFAKAAITTATTTGAAVPQKALVYQGEKAIVFMLSGEDTVRAQPVQIGEILNGGKVEITSGLKLGDRVVVTGAGYLKDGDRVRIVAEPLVTPNSP
jgi:RND family efflux transporter MFP subunit